MMPYICSGFALDLAGLAIEEEGAGDGYAHLLTRKID